MKIDRIIELLAETQRSVWSHPARNLGIAALFLVAIIGAMDAASPGELIIPDKSLKRASELELNKTLQRTEADRSMFAQFKPETNSRESVAVVSLDGVQDVPKPNRYVNLEEYGYRDLYAAHLKGECWSYRFETPDSGESLDAGGKILEAKLLISCPVPKKGALWGAVSVSYDSELIREAAAKRKLAKEIPVYSQLLSRFED